MPFWVWMISVSVSHALFHSTLYGTERIGVSSSSGCILTRFFGVSPESMCWHSFLAVMWVEFHFFTWYKVSCICILWSSTSSTSMLCSRVLRVMGEGCMCVAAGRLSDERLVLDRLMRVSKLVGV